MFGWGDASVCPIGIDIGTHSVHMLQFRHRPAQLSLLAAAAAEIPVRPQTTPETRAADVTATLRKLLTGGRFIGTRCVTALAPGAMHAKSVRLPQMPDSDLAQAVKWEAKDRMGFELSDGNLAYFRAGEVRRGTEIKDELLLFAATAEALREHIEEVSAAGLRLHAIDLQPCALVRALQRVSPSRAGVPSAIVDLGSSGTQLLIVQDDRLAFYKHIEIGADQLDAAVAQKLGVPLAEGAQIRHRLMSQQTVAEEGDSTGHLGQAVFDALRPPLEELARELDMCIRYFVVTFRGARPETITLAGPHAHCVRILEAIGMTLGLRVDAAQPLRGVQNLSETTRPDRASQWALAAGLSLYTLAEARATELGGGAGEEGVAA